MIRFLACKIASHVVDRHRVWHDSINYRTNCRRCGTPMVRVSEGWREFDPALDANAMRRPHPRFETPAGN